MITNNAVSHKCVAQQVAAYESLKTKETTSQVIPKSGRGRLRRAVAYVSFIKLQSLSDNSNGVSQW